MKDESSPKSGVKKQENKEIRVVVRKHESSVEKGKGYGTKPVDRKQED